MSDKSYAADLDEIEEEECQRELVKGCEFGFKVRDGKYLPNACRNLSSVRNFKLHSDDIIVSSYPKSGTTWTQVIVWLIQNDCDFAKCESANLFGEYIFLDPGLPRRITETSQPPRLIKNHMPVCFMPENLVESKAKVIYAVRNPKDTLVSVYNFYKCLKNDRFIGTFEDIYALFSRGKFAYGPWWEHVDGFANLPNCLIVHFEDLIEKPVEVIKEIAEFLGKSLNDEQARRIAAYTRFENFKKNEHKLIGGDMRKIYFDDDIVFFRKGQIGDWKNYFTDEMSREFDSIIGEKLKYNKKPFNYT